MEDINIVDSQKLLKLFEETIVILNGKKTERYHVGTVKNFIIHFNKLKETDKQPVYQELVNYLFLIREIDFPRKAEDSAALYNEFIYPIAKKYYYYLKFRPVLDLKALTGVVVIVELPLLILQCSVYWHIGLACVLIGLLILSYFDKKKNRVFGMLY